MTTATPAVAPGRRAVFHPLPVAAVDRLTADAVAITFGVPPALAPAYRFLPGQHVTIRTDLGGTGVRRSYSISEPVTTGRLRVGVKLIPGGAFSSFALQRLAPGDVLEVMTPTGRFAVEPDPARARHCVAIAAGSGITPVLSILASVLAIEPDSRCTLLLGNRTADSIMFGEDLADLKDRHLGRLAVHHFLSREVRRAPLLDGRLDRGKLTMVLAMLVPPASVDEWYLCGPPAMITEVRDTLLAHGVGPQQIHRELFHAESMPRPSVPATAPPVAGTDVAGSDVRIVLDGRQTRLELPPGGQPILDAVLAARPDAPYSCRDGVCGTCRARLVEGTVTMDRNDALEPAEVGLGYVLTCQSHPASPSVVLDYDA